MPEEKPKRRPVIGQPTKDTRSTSNGQFITNSVPRNKKPAAAKKAPPAKKSTR